MRRRPPKGYCDDQDFPGVHGGYYDPYNTRDIHVEVEDNSKSTFSGLFDAEGNPLFKPKPKLGFI